MNAEAYAPRAPLKYASRIELWTAPWLPPDAPREHRLRGTPEMRASLGCAYTNGDPRYCYACACEQLESGGYPIYAPECHDPGCPNRTEEQAFPFDLIRHEDETGISGTGHVAIGIRYPSGGCLVRWLGATPTLTWHPGGLYSVEAIHGHGGKTRIMVNRWPREAPDPLCSEEERATLIAALTVEEGK